MSHRNNPLISSMPLVKPWQNEDNSSKSVGNSTGANSNITKKFNKTSGSKHLIDISVSSQSSMNISSLFPQSPITNSSMLVGGDQQLPATQQTTPKRKFGESRLRAKASLSKYPAAKEKNVMKRPSTEQGGPKAKRKFGTSRLRDVQEEEECVDDPANFEESNTEGQPLHAEHTAMEVSSDKGYSVKEVRAFLKKKDQDEIVKDTILQGDVSWSGCPLTAQLIRAVTDAFSEQQWDDALALLPCVAMRSYPLLPVDYSAQLASVLLGSGKLKDSNFLAHTLQKLLPTTKLDLLNYVVEEYSGQGGDKQPQMLAQMEEIVSCKHAVRPRQGFEYRQAQNFDNEYKGFIANVRWKKLQEKASLSAARAGQQQDHLTVPGSSFHYYDSGHEEDHSSHNDASNTDSSDDDDDANNIDSSHDCHDHPPDAKIEAPRIYSSDDDDSSDDCHDHPPVFQIEAPGIYSSDDDDDDAN